MAYRPKKLTIFTILLATVLGCGKADYEAAMESQATNLAFGSRFIDNLHIDAEEVLDRVAELRLPSFMDDEKIMLRMTDKNQYNELRNPDRIQPPGMRIPGFKKSYEKLVDVGGRDGEAVYWYFAATDASQPAKSLEQQLRRDAAKTAPKSKPSFRDVSLDTPDRGTIKFRKLSVKGSQLFNTDARSPQLTKRNGQFDIYVHTTPQHHIIIGVRATDKAIAETKAMELASFAMGTLSVLTEPASSDEA